jgi:5-methylcytosine-specific restriction enzyme A
MPKLTKRVDRGSRDWAQLNVSRKRRAHQLRHVQPLCEMCLARGQITSATVADHVEPHRGNWNKFRLGRLQSLCKQCHDSRKQSFEHRGYAPGVGLDGMPLDSRHPCYSRSPGGMSPQSNGLLVRDWDDDADLDEDE